MSDLDGAIRKCVATRFMRGAPRAPSLAKMAEFINARSGRLKAVTRTGHCSTDRKLAGTRLRIPGKGRTGTLLEVVDSKTGEVVLHHNAAEIYRSNHEVAVWILDNILKKSRRKC